MAGLEDVVRDQLTDKIWRSDWSSKVTEQRIRTKKKGILLSSGILTKTCV